jgi:RND family efflux transporter MFP subunit
LAEAEAEIPRLKAKTAQLTTEKESMLATLDELKAARERAQLMLARTRITAPMDGRVLHLHAAPGMKKMLEGESPKSAAIVELYDPEKLQARIDVPLNEAAALRPGLPVEFISELLPDTVWTGTVTRVTGQADLQRNTLQAKVAIDDPDPRLRPEMLVRAKFYDLVDGRVSSAQAGGGRLSLYVLREAVIDDSSVWVVDSEGLARKKKVTLGDEEREGHRLVLDGLRSGETVILPPHDDLEEGGRVNNSNSKESQP